MKPALLIVELWGLGDLVIATPFLRAASEKFRVTLLAKPYALELQARLWPNVEVVPFVAPWTAFQRKYLLWRWPWRTMHRLRKQMRQRQFELGLSGRWDPRDHFLLATLGVKRRFGFPRLHSQLFLTHPVERPAPQQHRYEYWRALARKLELVMPGRHEIVVPDAKPNGSLLVHTGAGQPIRVWPLDRYRELVQRLRSKGYHVVIACDPDQRSWWLSSGEQEVVTPGNVGSLLKVIDQARLFIGNDSGPGHLAALCGVPTFTIFGPQLTEWFAPLHPMGICYEGKACPFKPCSDYCRFPAPRCLWNISTDEIDSEIQKVLGTQAPRPD